MFLVSGKTCEAGSSVDGAGKREFKCMSGRAGMLGVLLLLKYSGSVRQRDDREGAEEDSCFVSRRKQDPGCQKNPCSSQSSQQGQQGGRSPPAQEGWSKEPPPPRYRLALPAQHLDINMSHL